MPYPGFGDLFSSFFLPTTIYFLPSSSCRILKRVSRKEDEEKKFSNLLLRSLAAQAYGEREPRGQEQNRL